MTRTRVRSCVRVEERRWRMDKGGGGERRMYGENLFRFVETRLSDSMLIVLSLFCT